MTYYTIFLLFEKRKLTKQERINIENFLSQYTPQKNVNLKYKYKTYTISSLFSTHPAILLDYLKQNYKEIIIKLSEIKFFVTTSKKDIPSIKQSAKYYRSMKHKNLL